MIGSNAGTGISAANALVWVDQGQGVFYANNAVARVTYDFVATPTYVTVREGFAADVFDERTLDTVVVERDEADKRALALLMSHLTPEQARQYRMERQFEVRTAERRYRIRHGWAGNIEQLDGKGIVVARFCIHPSFPVPTDDNVLSQKLMIEANEELFLRTANRTLVAAR